MNDFTKAVSIYLYVYSHAVSKLCEVWYDDNPTAKTQ